MNRNQPFLTRIFSHNIVLLVLAFILSFSAWLLIKTNDETDSTAVIKDVPVTIELPEAAVNQELKLFKGGDEKVSVKVKGSRVEVAYLTEENIKVTSKQSSQLTAPGSYTLDLTASPASLTSGFSIESIDPPSIECFVDSELEREFTIDNKISAEFKDKDNKDKLSVDYALSNATVSVSGPTTQVSRIDSVAIVDTVTAVDANYDKTFTEKLLFYDEAGKELTDQDLEMIKKDVNEVEVKVTALPTKTVNLAVKPVNGPTKSVPEITISPKTVTIAGPSDTLQAISNDTIIIDSLNFSELDNRKQNKKISIKAPTGCKVVSENKEAQVSVDLSGYSQRIVTATISNRIDATAYNAEFASNTVDITLIGPEDKLEAITASGITAIADFTGMLDNVENKTMQLTVPLKISLSSDYSDCWIFNSYTTQASVSKKS